LKLNSFKASIGLSGSANRSEVFACLMTREDGGSDEIMTIGVVL